MSVMHMCVHCTSAHTCFYYHKKNVGDGTTRQQREIYFTFLAYISSFFSIFWRKGCCQQNIWIGSHACVPFKGTVAWDGFFAKSNPSGLVIKDLKYFWSGSPSYRVTAKITSLIVLAEYAKHVFSVLTKYAKWRNFFRLTKYFPCFFCFTSEHLIPNLQILNKCPFKLWEIFWRSLVSLRTRQARRTSLSMLGECAEQTGACSASAQNETTRSRQKRLMFEKTAKMFSKNLNKSKNICSISMKFAAKLAALVKCTLQKFELYSLKFFWKNELFVVRKILLSLLKSSPSTRKWTEYTRRIRSSTLRYSLSTLNDVIFVVIPQWVGPD